MGLLRHQLGESVLAAAEIFGNDDGGVVGGSCHDALDRVFDRDGLAGLEVELGRLLFGGVFGNLQRRIELDLAGVEALEQQIERHDFGQRGRMAQRVGIGCLQYRAAIAVDDDRRRWRSNILRRGHDGGVAAGRNDDACGDARASAASLVMVRAAATRGQSQRDHRRSPMRAPKLTHAITHPVPERAEPRKAAPFCSFGRVLLPQQDGRSWATSRDERGIAPTRSSPGQHGQAR